MPGVNEYYFRMLLAHSSPRTKYYAYPSGRVKYECKNDRRIANLTDGDWKIWKFSDANLAEAEGYLTGPANSEEIINALDWVI